MQIAQKEESEDSQDSALPIRALSGTMNPSKTRVYRSCVEVKFWAKKVPSVSSVRPKHCLGCGAASAPVGKPLTVHGDGTRERQLRGPLEVGGKPELYGIMARRYECQRCGACMLVVPREVVPHRLYTASAIALALTFWGLFARAAAWVRRQISPFRHVGAYAEHTWCTLHRWAEAAQLTNGPFGYLRSRGFDGQVTRRKLASRIAAAVAGRDAGAESLAHAAFRGASLHPR